ncbi:MAG: NAD(P)-dependent oxidoreductase [Alphaproteobacteria bacterium]|nr:NAD(P)-dependent oxidoreductase [Alphaproteobacteria bacterium]
MTETTPLRIGIIGLGSFGSRVAMRLLWNGFPSVNTYDQNDMTVRLFSNEYGAMGLGSPRMVAQTSDIVITTHGKHPA